MNSNRTFANYSQENYNKRPYSKTPIDNQQKHTPIRLILTRIIFYAYHRFFNFFLPRSGNDGPALLISILIFFFISSLCLFLFGFRPLDFRHLLTTSRYDKPSIVYGVDDSGKAIPIAEFYRQARYPLKIRNDKTQKKNERKLRKDKKNSSKLNELSTIENNPDIASPIVDSEIKIGLNSKIVRVFLTLEDIRFFSHPGVDPLGVIRAFGVNLLAGRVKEGASTFTQQVARLRFLSNERSLLRKLREVFLAGLLEFKYSKGDILEDYLNMVPLGHGTNGVEAAARFYFRKKCTELRWGEIAVIASMTTRPKEFSPLLNPRRSIHKVKYSLLKLIENGILSIEEAEAELLFLNNEYYAKLNRSPNESAFQKRLNLHPYATAFLRSQLPKEIRSDDILSTKGLRIYTTINVKHQQAAEKQMLPYLKEITTKRQRAPFSNYHIFDNDFDEIRQMNYNLFNVPDFKIKMNRAQRDLTLNFHHKIATEINFLTLITGDANVSRAIDHNLLYGKNRRRDRQKNVEGALISIVPTSGEITAVIGGSGFRPNNQQLRFHKIRRQPGSAFKPIIIAAALEASMNKNVKNKVTAASIFDDTPLHFINRDLSEYSPENYSRTYDGNIRLRRALTFSKNTIAIQVYRRVGSKRINEIAESLLQLDRLEPPRELPQEATVALGSYGLSPLQMTKAYAVFASGGKEVFTHLIKKIVADDGSEIYNYSKEKRETPRQLLNTNTAALMVSMLKDVVNKGTGKAAALQGRQVAGKTGTTNRSTNAWFLGFTPALVTAVYIGYDQPNTLGTNSTGGNLAAPVWGKYMYQALKRTPAKHYASSGNKLSKIEICESTGAVPTSSCEKIITEFFLPGTQPEAPSLNSDSNLNLGNPNDPALDSEEEEEADDILDDDDLNF